MTKKINVIIPLEEGKNWEKEFDKDEKIQKIVDEFRIENNKPEEFFMQLKHNNNIVNLEDPIETLISNNDTKIILNINLEKDNLDSGNANKFELIGKPLSNPFQVQVYNRNNNQIKLINFDKNEILNNKIENYSIDSAYCNGNDHLYISGGENKNNLILNDFWDIDLKNKKIEKICDLIEPKKNHSMICISEKYIFIVGGNSKQTFYYDIEKKEINNYANLNIDRIEPALIQIEDELYCFDNLKKGNNEITFEKTNLKESPKWEIIKPQCDENFTQKFFGALKLDNENILFIGGYMLKDNINNNDLMNFKYNIKNNIISRSDIPFQEMNLSEKNLYKIDKMKELIIPEYKKEEPEIIIINKEKKLIKKFPFELNNTKNKSSSLKLRNIKENPLKTYNYNMPFFNEESSKLKIKKYQSRNKIYNKNNSEDETTTKTKTELEVKKKFKIRNNNFENPDNIISTSKVNKNKKKSNHNKNNSENSFKGALLRNSVIKNNVEGSILQTNIPKIKKGNRYVKNEIVEVNEKFDKNDIEGLTQNINIGIGGKKGVN